MRISSRGLAAHAPLEQRRSSCKNPVLVTESESVMHSLEYR